MRTFGKMVKSIGTAARKEIEPRLAEATVAGATFSRDVQLVVRGAELQHVRPGLPDRPGGGGCRRGAGT